MKLLLSQLKITGTIWTNELRSTGAGWYTPTPTEASSLVVNH
jgi:hypothetical protein